MRRKGRISSVPTRSMISSWVRTEYANEPLVHRSMTRKAATTRIPHEPQSHEWALLLRCTFTLGPSREGLRARRGARPKMEAAPCGSRVLIWFSEFIDKFPRFLHSLFVKRGTNKDIFSSHAYVFLDALLRQEQGKRCVRLDFFLEKFHCTPS